MKDDPLATSDGQAPEGAVKVDSELPSDSFTRQKIGEVKIDGISDLAWLQTDLRQGDPYRSLPVRASVTCGRAHLTVEQATFGLATWQVMIRLKLDNAIVTPGSRRTISILDGSVEYNSITTSTLLTVTEQQHALDRLLPKQKAESRETKTTKSIPQIVLVGPFGEGITIGDPDYGDPLRPNGLLSFEYPSDGEPLFSLEPINPALPMRVSIITSVPYDKLHISSSISGKENIAHQEVRDRSTAAVRQYERLRRQMLSRELKARIARGQLKADLPFREGEFAIMIETFEIYPDAAGEIRGAKDR